MSETTPVTEPRNINPTPSQVQVPRGPTRGATVGPTNSVADTNAPAADQVEKSPRPTAPDLGKRVRMCLQKPRSCGRLRLPRSARRSRPPRVNAAFIKLVERHNLLRFREEANRATCAEKLELAQRKKEMATPRRRAQTRALLARFSELRNKIIAGTATARELKEHERIDLALSNPFSFAQEVDRLLPFEENYAAKRLEAELRHIEELDEGENVETANRKEALNKHRFMSKYVLAHREAYALDGILRNVHWTNTVDGELAISEEQYYDAIYEGYKSALRSVLKEVIVGLSGTPLPLPDLVAGAKRMRERGEKIADGYVLPEDRRSIQKEIERRRKLLKESLSK